jgi:hypothetical protein
MFHLDPKGDPAARPGAEHARELRTVYYDPETGMFREPWKTLDYGVLKFWQWRVAIGHLSGDSPIYGTLANRQIVLSR